MSCNAPLQSRRPAGHAHATALIHMAFAIVKVPLLQASKQALLASPPSSTWKMGAFVVFSFRQLPRCAARLGFLTHLAQPIVFAAIQLFASQIDANNRNALYSTARSRNSERRFLCENQPRPFNSALRMAGRISLPTVLVLARY